ncbi:MAG TPA: hypothetical protein VH744_10625 [Terriglobales bacterium]|jgi:hypothetical protein
MLAEFFTRERFGRPQFLAGAMLLVFLAQCAWLSSRSRDLSAGEVSRISEGLAQWRGEHIAGVGEGSRQYAERATGSGYDGWTPGIREHDPHHSPLWYLTAAAPLVLWEPSHGSVLWRWQVRLPYLAFGALLGASVWYVARRLYGNAGGYIALAFYCFSPGIIRSTCLWSAEPEIGAAWGTFGAIFTAIAVAHTLYAPREVVLWNWRRIGLLGLSLVLAIGTQFSLIVVLPLALAFMLYVAPSRKGAATAIWLAASGIGLLLLFASYFFRAGAFWSGVQHADFAPLSWRAYRMWNAYREVFLRLAQSSPALVIALPVALVTYAAWPRARYFGNTAPLLVSLLFVLLAIGTPHYPGLGFQLMAVPFLFVFVSGVSADLLETGRPQLISACVWGLLGASAMWNVWELARI